MITTEGYGKLSEAEMTDISKKKQELSIMILSEDFKESKIGKKFIKNQCNRLNHMLCNTMNIRQEVLDVLDMDKTANSDEDAFFKKVAHTIVCYLLDDRVEETQGFPMDFLKCVYNIETTRKKLQKWAEEVSSNIDINNIKSVDDIKGIDCAGNPLYTAEFSFKVRNEIKNILCWALYTEVVCNPKIEDKYDFLNKNFSFGKEKQFNILMNILYIVATNVSLTLNNENDENTYQESYVNKIETKLIVLEEDNEELNKQIEKAEENNEVLLKKIKTLEEKNEELKNLINKKDKELLKQEHDGSMIKNIEVDKPEIKEEIQEELIEVPNEEIEEITNESIDSTKKLLFVGGHTSTVKKLKDLYKNSEGISNCTTVCSANYLRKLDGIVFLTNFISHSLYKKIRNAAETNGCKWVHCPNENVDLIVKEINGNL
jgi:hypothetical protein